MDGQGYYYKLFSISTSIFLQGNRAPEKFASLMKLFLVRL